MEVCLQFLKIAAKLLKKLLIRNQFITNLMLCMGHECLLFSNIILKKELHLAWPVAALWFSVF